MGQPRTANKRRKRAALSLYMQNVSSNDTHADPRSRRSYDEQRAVMEPIERIDAAEIPGGGELWLLRCGSEFSIQFGEDELMGSQDFDSEKALASFAIGRMGARRDRILIGGLGMGFTLGAALAALPDTTAVVVAELVPTVVTWATGPLAHLFGSHLHDPRVSLEIRDVHDVIADSPAEFDAILLDVDNGPDGFMRAANDRLYCNWGLRSAYAALRPGGVLAIWSAYDDAAFVNRLKGAGFSVESASVDAVGSRIPKRYTIWLAVKPETSLAKVDDQPPRTERL